MSITYNKITEEIIQLYCENKPSKFPKCENEECLQNRCLCLDEEQIRLISFFAGFDYDVDFVDSQVTICQKETLDPNIFCQNDREFKRKLICCKGKNPEELKHLIAMNRQFLSEQSLFKIIRAIPLIQSINAMNTMNNRDTISYLCIYGKEAGFFLKGLLSGITCQLIREFIASKSSKNLVTAAEKIFTRISNIYNTRKDSDFKSVFMGNIRDYIKEYHQEQQSLILIANKLEQYYDELNQEKPTDSQDACLMIMENTGIEKTEILHLYRLFRQLMLIAKLEPSTVLDSFFEKALKKGIAENPIYDEIQEILNQCFEVNVNACSIRPNIEPEKKYSLLCSLQKMLSEEEGMCDEELDQLRQIFTQ